MSQGKFRCLRYKPTLGRYYWPRCRSAVYISYFYEGISFSFLRGSFVTTAVCQFVMSSDTTSTSDRARRLATNRERAASRRRSETAEARERRLARVTARRRERLASETAEERKTRLSRERLRRAARQRERLASEAAEERETRLSRERLRQAARRRELHVLHAMLSFHTSVQSITLFIVLLKFN